MTKEPLFSLIYPNLASSALGAQVIDVSDDFFAAAGRMLADKSPIFLPDKYDKHGKYMDGWESRRRRDDKHDWCIIKLAAPCRPRGLLVDTAHFTGNYPESVSVDYDASAKRTADWQPLLGKTKLSADTKHYFALSSTAVCHRLRLNIHPDGGIARFRLYGEAQGTARKIRGLAEVSGLLCGGRVIDWNNSHFGPPGVILKPKRAVSMQDGWETRRRRTPGHDWLVVRLPGDAVIKGMEIDTAYFNGNYPASCSVQACRSNRYQKTMAWHELLPQTPLHADQQHLFDKAINSTIGAVRHVRLNIYPDGGISRFRLLGEFTGNG